MIERVLHVICPGPILGAEKSVLAATSGLDKSDVDVELLVLAENRARGVGETFIAKARETGVSTSRIEVDGRLDLAVFEKLRHALKRFTPTVVHIHGYKSLFYFASMRAAGVTVGCPLVYSYHGATSHTPQVRLYEFLELQLMRYVDLVFAVSQGTASMLQQRGISEDQLVVVPNMLSFEKSKLPEKSSKSKQLRLLFVGRLSTEKGLDTLLAALGLLNPEDAPSLTVFGDGPLRPELEQMSRELELGQLVNFEGYADNIWQRANQFDALVMPSLKEGMPMALIEAQAAGLPVIASAVGGIPEMLDDPACAMLVAPQSPSELKEAIGQMRARIETYKKAARTRAPDVVDRYSVENWVLRANMHYERLAGVNGRADGS